MWYALQSDTTVLYYRIYACLPNADVGYIIMFFFFFLYYGFANIPATINYYWKHSRQFRRLNHIAYYCRWRHCDTTRWCRGPRGGYHQRRFRIYYIIFGHERVSHQRVFRELLATNRHIRFGRNACSNISSSETSGVYIIE